MRSSGRTRATDRRHRAQVSLVALIHIAPSPSPDLSVEAAAGPQPTRLQLNSRRRKPDRSSPTPGCQLPCRGTDLGLGSPMAGSQIQLFFLACVVIANALRAPSRSNRRHWRFRRSGRARDGRAVDVPLVGGRTHGDSDPAEIRRRDGARHRQIHHRRAAADVRRLSSFMVLTDWARPPRLRFASSPSRSPTEGFVAFVPHYFDAADGSDTLQSFSSFDRRVPKVASYAPRIAAAVDFALKQKEADSSSACSIGFLAVDWSRLRRVGSACESQGGGRLLRAVSDPRILANAAGFRRR